MSFFRWFSEGDDSLNNELAFLACGSVTEGLERRSQHIQVVMLNRTVLFVPFTGIHGKERKEYFSAVQSGLGRDYEPMRKVFKSVLYRTRRKHAQR